MLGTIVNTLAVAAGGAIGLLLKKGIPQKITDAVMQGLALCVIFMGISGALEGSKTLAMIVAMALGAVVGTLLDLDGRLNKLGDTIEAKMGPGGQGRIATGFVTASLLYCVGALAIVGSLQSGLTGDHSMLYTKSMLDFISSIVLCASLGVGVILSAVTLFLYQGVITLLAQALAPILTDAVIAEMTCVGSLLIIGMGLNMLGVTKIKIMNYVPAIFIVIGLCFIM
ncbi:MAG: DUF554 domain-containing protein [Clostridia bacterium]|nr:DUF554 domain-containing protein [Clostridia bacterium]